MRDQSVKTSARIILVFAAGLVVLLVGANLGLTFPVWAIYSLWVCNLAFPLAKKLSAAAIAIQVGQLAWLVVLFLALLTYAPDSADLAIIAGRGVILALGLVWLFVSQSRTAAIGLMLYQVATLVLFAMSAPSLIDQSSERGWTVVLPTILAMGIGALLAIGLLARFVISTRGQSRPAATLPEVTEVFD